MNKIQYIAGFVVVCALAIITGIFTAHRIDHNRQVKAVEVEAERQSKILHENIAEAHAHQRYLDGYAKGVKQKQRINMESLKELIINDEVTKEIERRIGIYLKSYPNVVQ
jgi:galactokinase